MDGSAETRSAETRQAEPQLAPLAPAGEAASTAGLVGGEVAPSSDPPGIAGWAMPDPLTPEEPPEIGLDIEGFPTCMVTAAPQRDDAGRYRLAWPLPAALRDGVARRIRAFHMISGLELDGSPVLLEAPPVAAPLDVLPDAPCGTGLRWPGGLAGTRAAGMPHEIAEGVLAEAEAPARTLGFELLAEGPDAPHGGITPAPRRGESPAPRRGENPAPRRGPNPAPRRGVRLVADAVAPAVTLHLRLGDATAGLPMAWTVAAWLPMATEAHVKARFDLTLERREGAAFHPLRRLHRATLFRRPADHVVEFTLTPEEAALLAEEGVWLRLTAHAARGLSAWLPIPGPPPLPAEPRFEDARLDGVFAHAVEFLRVHGEARREAHPLLPDLWQAPPRPGIAASPAVGAHPFTQVILPIYNGHDEVRECLHALRAAATGPMQVVMVDDGSRDFTAEMLRAEAAADPRFILHRRDVNRGYTKSINEGVLLTGADWVVVLNSDTLVPRGWLDRLHAAARARPGTGMVGPLSNAATWQSIPAAKRPDGSWSTNDIIAPRHLARMQAILDDVSEHAYPEFPVLNGFCTMIAREVFDRVGLYDEDAFPMGYGEETDLCLRARRAGFRLTLADDCFVYHHKSVSFGQSARARLSRAGGLEMTNKHSGVVVPALERMMQDCAPLGRLRARLTHLAGELN